MATTCATFKLNLNSSDSRAAAPTMMFKNHGPKRATALLIPLCIFVLLVVLSLCRSDVISKMTATGNNIAECPVTIQQESGVGKVVLVTGAAGFIGSHVAKYCAETLGMKVVALDDLSGGFMSNVPQHVNVEFVRGDVKDAALLEELFRKHTFDYVYHLAAYAAEGLSHFIRSYNYKNNLVGSVEVLNAAIKHKVNCFVFTSSIAVYGAGQTPMTEWMTPIPEDPYGIAKYAIELDLKAAKHMWDSMDYVIFRPHNVYGPNQNLFDRYRNVLGIFMNQILSGKPLTIFGDGEQTRAFSYIDDVAPIIARAPLVKKARGQIFNVGADKPYTLNTLAREVSAAMGVSPSVVHLDARKEVEHAESDHSKVHCFFRPPKAVDLNTGLKLMVEWVKSQGRFFEPIEFDAVEVLDSMPPSWVTDDMKQLPAVEHTGPKNTSDVRLKTSINDK